MLPAQLRGATGEIRIPDEAQGGEYDNDLHRLADLIVESRARRRVGNRSVGGRPSPRHEHAVNGMTALA